jgi:hypothetical protein
MTTDKTFKTIEMAKKVRDIAEKLEGIDGRHRMVVAGESFGDAVDVIAESHVILEEAVEEVKTIGKGLFEYVPRGLNVKTGKLVGTVHCPGNEWDLCQKYTGGGEKDVTTVQLTDATETAMAELLKVAVNAGVADKLFTVPSLKAVNIADMPMEVVFKLVQFGYKVDTFKRQTDESVSYLAPTLLNKGKGTIKKKFEAAVAGVKAEDCGETRTEAVG